MSAILTTLGLRAAAGQQPANHAAGFLVGNWFLAFCFMSIRGEKMYYGLDHNDSPREDLSKYGERAVQEGKLSRRTLEKLKRKEAAHANAQEGYPLFVAAMLLSLYAGLPNETINGIGIWYTLSRVAYSFAYSYIDSPTVSYLRSVTWWSGNISCVTALVLAGKKL
ncbi:hypothetical protein N7499_000098 [Penicillium canescens]|uniref:Uncharacterized protein n=1 Tax=Penicillium canescens TaxID=5083 RepID=A0AAD6NAT2_PENCN|nr:uncharacterized protein N7446_011703 [Penicillium canescens]KAJ6028956.1 hypothetical protein N7444_011943 [Penicillium canescens]KAJ6047390.1 hypothetical protein N7460_003537 [Penicillium canescens]KAJ6049020.1 hypothetical protein N7446_011703 [Penicillium canescens]KAJ6100468.1 hypothetical protein N7499_000098 [Penicillium canescens]KAJ6172932.1 hypothetical protein N7485_005744 [Penicillium canescens]